MSYLGVHSAEDDTVIAVKRQCWTYTQQKSPEQVPRGTAQAASPMSICKLKLCERSRTSEVTLSSAVILCWIPTENSLARQKWAKDDVLQHSSMFMQKFPSLPPPPLRGSLKGKTCTLFLNIIVICETLHIWRRKSRCAPLKRGAAAGLQSVAAVLQPYLAIRPASCPCGAWPPGKIIWHRHVIINQFNQVLFTQWLPTAKWCNNSDRATVMKHYKTANTQLWNTNEMQSWQNVIKISPVSAFV